MTKKKTKKSQILLETDLKGLPPKWVDLGHRELEIRLTPRSMVSTMMGAYSQDCGIVTVNIGYGRRETVNTLLHELLHSIYRDRVSLDHEKVPDQEELTVTRIADGLTELFARNPDLLKWIGKNV